MKKFFMISVLMGALPLSMVAQDDLYFVPKKKSAEVVKVNSPVNNRMESKYEVIQKDSTNDIIEFDGQKGIYPDSLAEDFELTKKMQRFEDYDLSDNAAFWAGYHLGRDTWDWGWTWHSPWYYRTYGWYGGWYDPWYYSSWRYGWYDPWYYGYYDPWYYGWYDPWYFGWGSDPWRYGYYGYYGYYSLGHPYYADVYYGGAPRRYSATYTSGTQNHGRIDYSGPRGASNGRTTTHSAGTFGGSSLGGSRTSTRVTAQDNNQRAVIRNSSGTFGGNRSYSGTYSNSTSGVSSGSSSRSTGTFSGSSTRSSSVGSSSSSVGSSMGSSSGGSFGGSRSSGSTMGGSRSGGGGGGGGSFGGGRRR